MRLAPVAIVLGALAPQEKLAVDASFDGTPREAMDVIHALAEDEPRRALGIARELAEDAELAEPLRAEFRFAEGVLAADALGPATAVRPFLQARALAGPGELRDAATYDQGTAELLRAEARREEAFAGMLAPEAARGADGEDPFAGARAAYLAAKATLLERLTEGADRSPEATADARANLELIQRRLRELDELEERRRERERSRPEGEPGEESGDEEQPAGEEGAEGGSEEDGEPREEEGEDGEPREGEDGESEAREDPGDPGAKADRPEGATSEELPDVRASDAEAQPAERHLSREEAMRLLDTLEGLEEELEELKRELRGVRRVPVEKDW